MEDIYYGEVDEVLDKLEVDRNDGLSQREVEKRIEQYGENTLKGKRQKTIVELIFDQFKSFLVMILIVAAVISLFIAITEGHDYIDGIIILVIVILNAILGVVQEKKASNALAALQEMSSPKAKVIRDGKIKEISSKELTVGDVVVIETGDYIPADIRLIESVNLKIEESALTGESVPVEKDYRDVYKKGDKVSLGDRKNMLFMSTMVTYGRGTGVVTGIGMETEIGKIAGMINEAVDEKTPLQEKLDQFGKILGIICIVVSVIIFILGMIQGKDLLDIFMTAVSLAVAAIPEGLPAVVTVVLALGMQRMVKRNAIMKRLSAVETLGSTTVICSDKTGTLTQNKMLVQSIYDLTNEYEVSGVGYLKEGDITLDGEQAEINTNLDLLLKTCCLCNDAKIKDEENDIIGDPTEGALLVLGLKADYHYEELNKKYKRIQEFPFDSERKLMSVINDVEDKHIMFTKGAFDQLLKRCKYALVNGEKTELTDEIIKNIQEQNLKLAKNALRVLAYAYKEVNESVDIKEEENDLIFLGITGMIDPPREEAKVAIKKCHSAGIRVVMITGDHKLTATAIGSELGIVKDEENVLSGDEIDDLSDQEFIDAVRNVNVFARVSPEHKVRIVSAIQDHGEIVAMTGDGVNDAPALKKAEIGVAMGITGTDVSKQAADMILTDDNFTSIVDAVEEGRTIFINIRKFISFLISCNIGEILLILVAMIFTNFFGGVIPLVAIQLLWINLMTDSFPAFAIGLEESEGNVMEKKPRDPKEPIANKSFIIKVVFQALGLAIGALTSFKLGLEISHANMSQADPVEIARTMTFVTVVVGELLRAFSSRSESKTIFQINMFGNKFLNYSVVLSLVLLGLLVYVPLFGSIFHLVPLDKTHILIAVGLSFIPLIFAELSKFARLERNIKE
ncbi:calcium-translocating P-type ATPase, PMCA-type [Haloplasma contractile]|uniref:P-type Ca(2+) transporter n=1 Tax=Haloplasma contractile SSD-17B TaxID=1033810 RepID=U2EDL9_9MOLU|nr:calcium-translocating P-type ATPase, PMCA-type [Haloplasma contractile]ERJ13078.1 Ca2+ transporting ATPase sarcoplasmic-endoplasmic reticulum protein [Haloplasma contractile SSD-17B]